MLFYLLSLFVFANSIGYGIKHIANILRRSDRDRNIYLKEYWLHLAVNVFIVLVAPWNTVVINTSGGSGSFIIIGIIGAIIIYYLKLIE